MATHSWERMVVVQTMSNLGIPQYLPLMKSILKSSEYDSNVKRAAVLSMIRIKLAEPFRQEVRKIHFKSKLCQTFASSSCRLSIH